MEALLKSELGYTTVKAFGSGGGGCINQGQGYDTDKGKIFVKMNSKPGARLMFEGEAASLTAILSTDTVKAPEPFKVFDNPKGGAMLVTEYLDMKSLSHYAGRLGEQLAKMHLHNAELGRKQQKHEGSVHKEESDTSEGQKYVPKFGFHCTTCCGIIPQDNSWEDDWVTFYMRHKVQQQMDMVERDYGDREALDLWKQAIPKIPKLFEGLEITPALLHGDLWGGNAAELSDNPVIFDPASFYGHHEFELSISQMFGGFSSAFFQKYHSLVPQAPGFQERSQLYKLFHYLNHWNHFGSGYRGQSVSILRRLAKS